MINDWWLWAIVSLSNISKWIVEEWIHTEENVFVITNTALVKPPRRSKTGNSNQQSILITPFLKSPNKFQI